MAASEGNSGKQPLALFRPVLLVETRPVWAPKRPPPAKCRVTASRSLPIECVTDLDREIRDESPIFEASILPHDRGGLRPSGQSSLGVGQIRTKRAKFLVFLHEFFDSTP